MLFKAFTARNKTDMLFKADMFFTVVPQEQKPATVVQTLPNNNITQSNSMRHMGVIGTQKCHSSSKQG